MTNHFQKRPSVGRRVLASALCLVAVLALPLEAFAGACQMTKRDYAAVPSSSNDGAHTTAHNDTKSASFVVTIDRGNNEKAKKTITPGDMVGQFAKFGDPYNDTFVNFTVNFSNPGDTKPAVACAFRIKNGQNSVWDLAADAETACGDATALCPTCKISCDKSYHAGQQRWNTTFKITN